MTARRSIDKLAPQVPETSVRAAPIDRADRAQRDAAAAFDIPKGIFTTPAEEAADFTIEDPPGESDAEIIRRLARMPSLDYERILLPRRNGSVVELACWISLSLKSVVMKTLH